MKLSGKTTKTEKPAVSKKQRAESKVKAKSKAMSTKRKRVELDDGDEIITATPQEIAEAEAQRKPKVQSVPSFEGGFVHPCLQNAVNAHWRRSNESDVFMQLLSKDLYINGTFFGSIFVKSSFAKKTGGGAIM